jgi:hypothetical protein
MAPRCLGNARGGELDSFYRRAQGGGEANLRTKARKISPGRGMAVGAATTCTGAGQVRRRGHWLGLAATVWTARRGRAARADWESRAVARKFLKLHMDRQTKDWPRRADLADRGAGRCATPALRATSRAWARLAWFKFKWPCWTANFSKFLN